MNAPVSARHAHSLSRSILVTVLFSSLVFHEKLTEKSGLGLAGIVAGTLLMLV